MNTKKMKWVPSIVVALIISMGACMKLVGLSQLVELYSKIGLLPFLQILGVVELLFTAIFLVDRFLKIGLLLLTGYFGGAMAVELSHGTIFIFPAVILSAVWIAAYLRNPGLFLLESKTESSIKFDKESI